jgi:hypothetical protein
MTDSTGTKEKKEKKPGLAATITAVAALLAAGGTMVKDITGQREQELVQESIFNYATAETAAIRERLARLETHMEWLRGGVMEDMMPAMASAPGCSSDDECGITEHCVDGECLEPVTEESPLDAGSGGGGGGGGHLTLTVTNVDDEDPPPPPPAPRGKPQKFEDLKQYIQTEQRAWAD